MIYELKHGLSQQILAFGIRSDYKLKGKNKHCSGQRIHISQVSAQNIFCLCI